MGLHSPDETMALRWAELCNDPRLQDLLGKLELNDRGAIEA